MKETHPETYTSPASIGRGYIAAEKKHSSTLVGAVARLAAGVVAVVMHTARLVVEDLDDHVPVAFVEEVHQAPFLDVVLAGELLPAGREPHLPLAVEPDLHGPAADAATCLPQVQLGRFPLVEKLGELVGELLPAERVGGGVDDELEVVEVVALLIGRRRGRRRLRRGGTAGPATAPQIGRASCRERVCQYV